MLVRVLKILVTGANGQLGKEIMRYLKNTQYEYLGVGRKEFDICDSGACKKALIEYRPDIVIHCASYNKVDNAEIEYELCMKTNYEATKSITDVCKKLNAKLIFFSTDYVFDGEKKTPYQTDDETCPISTYGKSKAYAENYIMKTLQKYFIIRISWLFGYYGNNFVKTILNLGNECEYIRMVEDQTGSPTYTKDLTELTFEIIKTNRYGVYHITNEGFCSRKEFANKVFSLASIDIEVIGINSEEYKSLAKRPENSKLSKECLDNNGFYRLVHWEDALYRYLEELNIVDF